MRGGKKVKEVYKDGQRALIDAIWKAKGGVSCVARLAEVGVQSPNNWRKRGGVPLVMCKTLASILNVPQWALNYAELKEYDASTCPPWEVVVRGCRLSRRVVDYILSLEKP